MYSTKFTQPPSAFGPTPPLRADVIYEWSLTTSCHLWMAPFIILLVGAIYGRGSDSEPAGRVDVEDDGLDVELVAAAVVVVLTVWNIFSRSRVLSLDVTVKSK